jgi:hypothetical protein
VRSLAWIEVGSPKITFVSSGMNIDRYSLAESELEVLERIGLRRRGSGAQTGEPQIGRAEFPVTAIGVFDLGRIAGRPGHGFFHARSPVSAWEPIPNPQQRFCAKSFGELDPPESSFIPMRTATIRGRRRCGMRPFRQRAWNFTLSSE